MILGLEDGFFMTKSAKESSSDTTLVSIFGRLAGDFGNFEMVVFLFFFATLGFFFAALGFFFATLGFDHRRWDGTPEDFYAPLGAISQATVWVS